MAAKNEKKSEEEEKRIGGGYLIHIVEDNIGFYILMSAYILLIWNYKFSLCWKPDYQVSPK